MPIFTETPKAEIIGRASLFPYWEVRDEQGLVLRNSGIKNNTGEPTDLEGWLDKLDSSNFYKVLYVRYGASAKSSERAAYFYKTPFGQKAEEEGESLDFATMMFHGKNAGNHPATQEPVYFNTLGGMKQIPNPQQQYQQSQNQDMKGYDDILRTMEMKLAEERANNERARQLDDVKRQEEIANMRIDFERKLLEREAQKLDEERTAFRKEQMEFRKEKSEAPPSVYKQLGEGALGGLTEVLKGFVKPKEQTPLSGMENAKQIDEAPKAKSTFKIKGSENVEIAEKKETSNEYKNPLAGLSEAQVKKMKEIALLADTDPELIDDFYKYAHSIDDEEETVEA